MPVNNRLSQMCHAFLMKQGNDDVPCRFDVVAIAGAEGQEEITLYKDAFTLM